MQEARANFGIAVVDGKIYAFGGDNGSPSGNLLPRQQPLLLRQPQKSCVDIVAELVKLTFYGGVDEREKSQ